MRRNFVKQRLKRGDTVIGTMVQEMRTPAIAQIERNAAIESFLDTYADVDDRDLLAEMIITVCRLARDGCGLPTVSNTVGELAVLYAGVAATRDEDWIWDSMVRHPDLIGGFNRLDSTAIKVCGGSVVAKEGADGLLGLSVVHDDFPDGLGVVVKIAHGWNPVATWYVARAVLGVLGFELRNPYPLHRQKAFIVPGVVPEAYRDGRVTFTLRDHADGAKKKRRTLAAGEFIRRFLLHVLPRLQEARQAARATTTYRERELRAV